MSLFIGFHNLRQKNISAFLRIKIKSAQSYKSVSLDGLSNCLQAKLELPYLEFNGTFIYQNVKLDEEKDNSAHTLPIKGDLKQNKYYSLLT